MLPNQRLQIGQGEAALTEYIRQIAYTINHPVSTCRMGSDGNAVVDAELRVQGIAGLRVADASIFPQMVGGNINAAVVMVAEKASDMILGRPPLADKNMPDLGDFRLVQKS